VNVARSTDDCLQGLHTLRLKMVYDRYHILSSEHYYSVKEAIDLVIVPAWSKAKISRLEVSFIGFASVWEPLATMAYLRALISSPAICSSLKDLTITRGISCVSTIIGQVIWPLISSQHLTRLEALRITSCQPPSKAFMGTGDPEGFMSFLRGYPIVATCPIWRS